jgi:hypothetical protein
MSENKPAKEIKSKEGKKKKTTQKTEEPKEAPKQEAAPALSEEELKKVAASIP